MKIKKIILYKKLNKKIYQEYSRFKFGDPIIIEKYVTELTKIIKKYIKESKNYIIHTTAKSPLNKYCKKNSLILSEKVAKKLKLFLLIGEYNHHYNREKFYDNTTERKVHPPVLKTKIKKEFKKCNCHILMIDDAILTGNTLKASVDLLRGIANKITFFSIINLQKQKYSEKKINNFYYREKGFSFLLKLLKNKNYIPTSNFVRTIEALEEKDKEKLIKDLNKKQRKLMEKAFKIYTGRIY